jgi:hypothetical protein
VVSEDRRVQLDRSCKNEEYIMLGGKKHSTYHQTKEGSYLATELSSNTLLKDRYKGRENVEEDVSSSCMTVRKREGAGS